MLHAQPVAALRGPISGFILDRPSSSIRPVAGVLGASYLGAPVIDGAGCGSVAPNGRRAAFLREGRWHLALNLEAPDELSTGVLDGLAESETCLVGWAPDSNSVVIFAAGRGLRMTGLDANPRATDLPGLPQGAAVASAVGKGAEAIFLAMNQGDTGAVFMLSGGSAWTEIAQLSQPAAIVMSPESDALYGVAHSGQVWQVRNFHESVILTPLLALPEGAAGPVGLAVSLRGDRIFVASKGAPPVVRCFDLATGQMLHELPLDAPPTSMQVLSSPSVFLLTSRASTRDQILVLDARGDVPTVFFIPVSE
jgi:hypothetical protein